MQRSEQINELATALAKAQGEMKAVKKGEKAEIEMKSGGRYSYTYADLSDVLDALRAPLAANGLALIQTATTGPNFVEVETLLAHASGQWISHVIAMAAAGDPKSIGSAITYGRRYGLCITGAVTEDDDDAAGVKVGTGERLTSRPHTATETAHNVTAGLAQNCPKCGGPMWDNREGKRNPNAPDFKCRDKECDGAIWPKKDNGTVTMAPDDAANEVPEETMPKLAKIRTPAFGRYALAFVTDFPKYKNKQGGFDAEHICAAVAQKLTILEITDTNIEAVFAALREYAREQAALPAQLPL